MSAIVFDPSDQSVITRALREDGQWVALCHRCPDLEGNECGGVYLGPPVPGFPPLDWGSLEAAYDGALDHARREHWTPGVAK